MQLGKVKSRISILLSCCSFSKHNIMLCRCKNIFSYSYTDLGTFCSSVWYLNNLIYIYLKYNVLSAKTTTIYIPSGRQVGSSLNVHYYNVTLR
jgi:hypothetical protein